MLGNGKEQGLAATAEDPKLNAVGLGYFGNSDQIFSPRIPVLGEFLPQAQSARRIPRGIQLVVRPDFIVPNSRNNHHFQEDGNLLPVNNRPLRSEVWQAGFKTAILPEEEWSDVDQGVQKEYWQYGPLTLILTVRGRMQRPLGNSFMEVLAYPESRWPDLGDSFISRISDTEREETEVHYVIDKSHAQQAPVAASRSLSLVG